MYTLSSTILLPSTIAHYSCSFSYFVSSSFLPFHLVCMFGRCTPHVTSSRRTVAVHIVKVHRRMRTPALLLAHVRACAHVLCTRGLRGRYNTSCGPFYDARITHVREHTRKRSRARSGAHSRESVRTRARLSAVEHRTQCRKSVVSPSPRTSRPNDFDAGAYQQQVTRLFLASTSTLLVSSVFYLSS